MIRYLLIFVLLFGLLSSQEYPHAYTQLGTPLYKFAKKISKYKDIELLQNHISTYITKANTTLAHGIEVDKSKDKREIKKYLFELRKLQKDYDYLLHLLNESINDSIDSKNYKLFLKLTSYDFDGLLKSKSLRNKAIEFYKKNKNLKRCRVLDEKIKFYESVQENVRESYAQSVVSTFDPTKKKIDPKKSVIITTKQNGRSVSVSFTNKNIYDVTVEVEHRYKNIKESKNTPKVFVLKANSTINYTKLSIGHGQTYYQYSYRWIIGDKNAVHNDNYIYALPYARGTSHVVSQGFNGKYTHKGSSQYAIDFVMDQGTKIYAARGGVVVKTKSDSNRGGYFRSYINDSNYVIILHDDGTLATYNHLMKNGVAVNVGDIVQRGSLVGYSGNTGYSSGPHLHFAVFKAINAKKTHSIPIKFDCSDGIVNEPIRGVFYTAK